MDREDIKMLVKKWWDIYNDESLDFKKTTMASPEAPNGTTEQMNLQAFLDAMSGAGAVRHVRAPSAA